jgi:hypothetical protein
MALFMVVEHYIEGPGPVYARFAERGRMLPAGLRYVDSWVVAPARDVCFQLMEADDPGLFDAWIARWGDLVRFEIHEVMDSAEAAARSGG